MPLLRTIGGRFRDFRMVKRAVMHHGQRIAEALDARVNSLLPQERRIDFWLYMLAIVDLLRLRSDRMATTEHDLVGERGNDARVRKERDDDSETLRVRMRTFRNAFDSNYLPLNLEEFGFPAVLDANPFELVRQADHLVEIFGRPTVKVPEPKIGCGLPISEELAEIKLRADVLRSSLDSADRELKLAEFAKVDKDDAVAGWDELFPWAVRTVTGLFILAGRPDLAAKVLPAPARRGQTGTVEEEGDPSGGGVDPSEPPASEEPTDEPPSDDSQPPSDNSESDG